MTELRNPQHAGHVATDVARELLSDLLTGGPTSGRELVNSIAITLLGGIEFGLRFGKTHPDQVEPLLEWLVGFFDQDTPLEVRERILADEFRQMLTKCGPDHEPL